MAILKFITAFQLIKISKSLAYNIKIQAVNNNRQNKVKDKREIKKVYWR